MLSLKAIKSAQTAGHYFFEKDHDYYHQDTTHEKYFEWQGKGASLLGLHAQVNREDFHKILQGILPNGEQLGITQDHILKHRPGFDLTFSAPKSVSILALAGGDQRLIDLHNRAVSVALTEVEKLAAARVTQGGKTTFENTNNLVIAKFMHDTSRENDPQLHTHAVIANMTQRKDGAFRSLASDLSRKQGFYERVMDNQIYLGLIYRSELAKGLKDLGFELETVNKHGMFEIKGISQELRDHFSKRRTQIESHMSTRDHHSLKAYDMATLSTRKAKVPMDRISLTATWETDLKTHGFSTQDFLKEVESHRLEKGSGGPPSPISREAIEAVQNAIAYFTQKTLRIEFQDIAHKASEYALGRCAHTEIIKAMEDEIHKKELIPLDEHSSMLTTKALLDLENRLMERVEKSKSEPLNIRIKPKVFESLEANAQDKTLIQNMMTAKDGILVLNHASKDKFAFLGTLLNTLEAHGKDVKILSPSAVHAIEVSEKVQRSTPTSLWQWLGGLGKEAVSDTVPGFNFKTERDFALPIFISPLRKGVLIVDSAQKIAPEDLERLLILSQKLKSKVILLNDAEAQKSFFKADPIQVLEKAHVRAFERRAEKVESHPCSVRIYGVKEDPERVLAISRHYTKLSSEGREHPHVITDTKAHAEALNLQIRSELKNAGILSHCEHKCLTYQPVFMSKIERALATHYQKGMVLRQELGRGITQDYSIEKIITEENALWLKAPSGKMQILPCKKISEEYKLFHPKALSVSAQEHLIATGNMANLHIQKGETFKIASLSDKSLQLEHQGKKISISYAQLEHGHFDHAYAGTLQKTRFDTKDTVLAYFKSRAVTQEVMKELNRRTQGELHFYTDDPEKAEVRFSKITERSTAIDLILKAYHEKLKVERVFPEAHISAIKQEVATALKTLTEKTEFSYAEKAVDYAISKLSERNAGFTHQLVMETALKHALGEVRSEDLEASMEAKAHQGTIVSGKDTTGALLWTTQEALDLEREIIKSVQTGKNTLAALMQGEFLAQRLAQTSLTQGQKDACYLIGTTQDRFVMVQGYAGTGKSTMLETFLLILQEHMAHDKSGEGLSLIACAPTHQAVKELKDKGLNAQTLKSFLVEDAARPFDLSKTLVVLDESSMVSNKDFRDFQKIIERAQGRAVLIGDKAQLLSVESGKPFEIIMREGNAPIAYMTHIVRQETETLKNAVMDAIGGEHRKAFEKIESQDPSRVIARDLKETDDPSHQAFLDGLKTSLVDLKSINTTHKKELSLQEAVAIEYLSRTKEVRDQTLILAHAHEDRKEIHKYILEGLKKIGEIETAGVDTARLIQKQLTRVEIRHIDSFEVGDCLKINNTYGKITEVESSTRSIQYMKEDNTLGRFYPEHSKKWQEVALFSEEKSFLSQGIRVKFTKTDKERGIFANREWCVKAASIDSILLQEKDTDRILTLNPNDMKDKHWDYAYTVTGYGAQGSSAPFVIDHEESSRKNLTNQRSFYIAASRAKQHVMIYTNDKEDLIHRVCGNEGNKYAALEVVGELKQLTKAPETQQIAVDLKTKTSPAQKTKEPKEMVSQKKTHALEPRSYHLNKEAIHRSLKAQAEYVVEHLLGPPNKTLSNAQNWRYGTKGGISICLHGKDRGLWNDFDKTGKTIEKGDLFSLIQSTLNLSFKESLRYGANLVGAAHTINPITHYHKAPSSKEVTAQGHQANVTRLIRQSLPISGTLAERYLKKTRKIETISSPDLRFLPSVYTGRGNYEIQKYAPALLSIARNVDGVAKSIQMTYLDPKTLDKAELPIKKRTSGSLSQSVVQLQSAKDKSQVTYITEGIETGLSVANAKPNAHVIATLGKSNFLHVDPKVLSKEVVFCLDNDGDKTLKDSSLLKAIERLESFGKTVSFVMPDRVENKEKSDFNDILKDHGMGAIQEKINNKLPSSFLKENIENIIPKQIKQLNQHELISEENATQIFVKSLLEQKDLVPSIQREEHTHRLKESTSRVVTEEGRSHKEQPIERGMEDREI